MCSRNRCYLAELYRRLGRQDEVLELVKTAERTHRAENLPGVMAMHTLPMLAKLTPDAEEARVLLDCAEATHRLRRNDLGLVHVLCLRARRLRTARDRERIELFQRSIPMLSRCEIARRIATDFEAWITPEPGAGPVDYWGL